MDTQTSIELVGVLLAATGAARGAWLWRRHRWRLVSDLVSNAERYLEFPGNSAEALANRSEACSSFDLAVERAETLEDGRLDKAARELADEMNFGDDEQAVTAKLTTVRRRRWW